jgi:hypothetical protein
MPPAGCKHKGGGHRGSGGKENMSQGLYLWPWTYSQEQDVGIRAKLSLDPEFLVLYFLINRSVLLNKTS